MVLKRSK